MTRFKLRGTLAAALLLATLPGIAHAGSSDRARSAIAEARGKIEAGEQAGTGANAADVQARARAKLAIAEREFRKGHQDNARYAAREADALAELAIATSEYRRLASR